MFEINKNKNRITELPSNTFVELKFRERAHLQEWLLNTPDALGEELLIIQKEFDGFHDTRERLDLLALDKEGALVIIENKLDDSGRNAVCQALKYVAYCSTLKKSDIIKIFQDYLRQQNKTDDAAEIICDFLGRENIEETIINTGTNQRIILVAAKFHKVVTSTVLWLIDNGINAQCLKVTPYKFNGKFLLDINQIIPTPDARDYMIGMSSKQNEEKKTRAALQSKTQQLRINFWENLLDYFREKKFDLYKINKNTLKDQRLNAGPGISGCYYTLIFLKNEARVEFIIGRRSKEESKRMFDVLFKRKDKIEESFGEPLEWLKFEEKKISRIILSKKFDSYNEENWTEIIEWLYRHIHKMEAVFKPYIPELKKITVSSESKRDEPEIKND